MMKHAVKFYILILFLFIILQLVTTLYAQESSVSITDRGTYYEIILDYTTGISHFEMGKLMAKKVLQFIPKLEQMSDKFLSDLTANQTLYDLGFTRMYDIKPQVHQEYLDEMEGLASVLCSSNNNIRNDEQLSKDEIFVLFLSDDVFAMSECSSISVFGPRSALGSSITAKISDNYDNTDNFQALTRAVTTIKNKNHSICMIGGLSIGSGIAFNDDGIFIGLHSSYVGTEYSSKNKRSYIMDLRYALENFSSSDEIANYITGNSKNYVSNRLIQITDKNSTRILENNFSGTGKNMRCTLRSDTSALNPGITWEYPNAIATANSFVLLGNHDNHTGELYATERWKSIKSLLNYYGEKITPDELKSIASYDKGDGPGLQAEGDIYNISTLHTVIFQPDNFHLEIAFRPRTGILPDDPVFEEIPVHIGKTTLVDNKEFINNEYKLAQNYPNPFNPLTVIGYAIGTSTIGTSQLSSVGTRRGVFVQLKVYDILGNEVATLVNEEKAPGYYQVEFDAGKYNLSSGIYFYRLKAGEFISTRKFILMK